MSSENTTVYGVGPWLRIYQSQLIHLDLSDLDDWELDQDLHKHISENQSLQANSLKFKSHKISICKTEKGFDIAPNGTEDH